MLMTLLLYGLTALLIVAGITHFIVPGWYERLVPSWAWLPRPRTAVYLTGLVEIVLAFGLVNGLTRIYAAWATVALFAVYVASHFSAYRRADASQPRWLERPTGAGVRVIVNLGYLAAALTLAVWVSIPATATEHAQPDRETQEPDAGGPAEANGPSGADEDADGDRPEPGRSDADDTDAQQPIAPAQIGRGLVAAGLDGIRLIDGATDVQVWAGATLLALPDGEGGVVLQHHAPHLPAGRGAIAWLPAGADAPAGPPVTFDEEGAWLHAVVELDGNPTVLFTRRVDDNGESEETLYAHTLADGVEVPLAVTGGIESGLDAVVVHDGRLLLSTCHLQCNVVARRPTMGTDDPELLVPSDWYEGLAVAGDRMVQLERPFDFEGRAGPVSLWLHDLATGERRQVALPVDTASIEQTTARVDLAADGSAALVSFVPWDEPSPALTLLVDDLDARPRIVPVETRERLVFAR